jgi:hypothetical protein
MDAFVAAPNTFIVERVPLPEGQITTKLPVVGWVYVQGTVAFPICPLAYGGLTDKRAVLLPSGMVCDRFFGETFANLEEWESACDLKGPIDRSGAPDPDSVIEERPRTVDTLRKPSDTPARKPKRIRTLQQKSFWGKKDEQVILVAEGGAELPDDRDWMKITRDEFQTRKRDGYVVWPDENGPGGQPAETPEEPETGGDLDDLI